MEYHHAERQCLSSKVLFTISNICAMLGKSEYYIVFTYTVMQKQMCGIQQDEVFFLKKWNVQAALFLFV